MPWRTAWSIRKSRGGLETSSLERSARFLLVPERSREAITYPTAGDLVAGLGDLAVGRAAGVTTAMSQGSAGVATMCVLSVAPTVLLVSTTMLWVVGDPVLHGVHCYL